MPEILEFSKLAVPDATGAPTYVYQVKDTIARQALAGSMKFIISWDGDSTPVVSNIPNTVSVRYNGTVYTGTLNPAVAHNDHPMSFWLVSNGEGGNDGYAEYVPVEDDSVTPSTWSWEKLGDVAMSLSNLGALAYMDSVDLEKGSGANVIGENATLSASSSSVTFTGGSTDSVLGADTTFTATGPTIADNSTTKSLSVVMGSVTVPDTSSTQSVLTELKATGTGTNDTKKQTFLKSSTSLTKTKYKTASVTGLNGTETKTGSTGKTRMKLNKISVTPAKSKSISGSDLVTPKTAYLKSKTVKECQTAVSVNVVSTNTPKKLQTDTFNKVTAPSGAASTVKGLTVSMYNSQTHGNITGADSETLVLAFSTTPTLELSSSSTRFSTGSLIEDGASGTTQHTTYTNEVGGQVSVVTSTSQTVVPGSSDATVADKTLSSTSDGDAVSIGLTSSSVIVAQVDNSVYLADGTLVPTSTTGDSAGATIVSDLNDNVSITVPKAASSSTTVVTSTTTTNTSDSYVEVGTSLNTTDNTADAYTDLKFNTQSVLKSTTTQTPTAQLKLNNGTAADSVNVVTAGGVSVTGSYSVSANNNDTVTAVTGIGTGTAAAQTISWTSKDSKKVALYDDLKVTAQANPVKRYLNFVMPFGGTIKLVKNGTPTARSFEYSLDGVNWYTWTETNDERSMTLASGDRLFVRNASDTSTELNSSTNQYRFTFDNTVYAYGNVMSLLCKIPENAVIVQNAFRTLFYNDTTLVTGPDMPSETTASYCYMSMYSGCGSLVSISYLPAKTPSSYAYSSMCNNCGSLATVRTGMTNISATGCVSNWLSGVAASGTFYCDEDLSITANSASGIPSGWTRFNINE